MNEPIVIIPFTEGFIPVDPSQFTDDTATFVSIIEGAYNLVGLSKRTEMRLIADKRVSVPSVRVFEELSSFQKTMVIEITAPGQEFEHDDDYEYPLRLQMLVNGLLDVYEIFCSYGPESNIDAEHNFSWMQPEGVDVAYEDRLKLDRYGYRRSMQTPHLWYRK